MVTARVMQTNLHKLKFSLNNNDILEADRYKLLGFTCQTPISVARFLTSVIKKYINT